MKTKLILKEKTTSTEQEQCLEVGLGLKQTEVATLSQSVEVRKSYKFRLYPNKEQTTALANTIELCRVLYNTALQERIDSYSWYKNNIANGKKVEKPVCNRATQSAQLPPIRESCPEYKGVYAQVLQEVLGRLEGAFANFYRRLAKGEKAGFPRFKSRSRYDSFVYPDPCKIECNTKAAGWSLCNSKLTLSKVGGLAKTSIKIKVHRGVMGRVCQLSIKREGNKWFACFSVVYLQPLEVGLPTKAVGVDVGLNSFAVLSNGEQLANPRFYRKSQEKLAVAQQKASGKKRGSKRSRKARRDVSVIHRKIANQRKDFLHKASRKLVNEFDAIFFEDLSIDNMVRRPKPKADPQQEGSFLANGAAAKGGLNKSIMDAGWGYFSQMVAYKAADAGKLYDKVDPRGTSQVCSECDKLVPKTLSERVHKCPYCGIDLDRDHNSAREIEHRGLFKHNLLPILSWNKGAVCALREQSREVLGCGY